MCSLDVPQGSRLSSGTSRSTRQGASFLILILSFLVEPTLHVFTMFILLYRPNSESKRRNFDPLDSNKLSRPTLSRHLSRRVIMDDDEINCPVGIVVSFVSPRPECIVKTVCEIYSRNFTVCADDVPSNISRARARSLLFVVSLNATNCLAVPLRERKKICSRIVRAPRRALQCVLTKDRVLESRCSVRETTRTAEPRRREGERWKESLHETELEDDSPAAALIGRPAGRHANGGTPGDGDARTPPNRSRRVFRASLRVSFRCFRVYSFSFIIFSLSLDSFPRLASSTVLFLFFFSQILLFSLFYKAVYKARSERAGVNPSPTATLPLGVISIGDDLRRSAGDRDENENGRCIAD